MKDRLSTDMRLADWLIAAVIVSVAGGVLWWGASGLLREWSKPPPETPVPQIVQPGFGYGYAKGMAYNRSSTMGISRACFQARWRNRQTGKEARSVVVCVRDLQPQELRDVSLPVDCDPQRSWASCDPVDCADAEKGVCDQSVDLVELP